MPTSELPAGRISTTKLMSGTATTADTAHTNFRALVRPPSNYLSSKYRIKPRESIAGMKRLASAKIKQELNQYL